ncbi:hypothetical protein CABS01_12463 [Colletotrichum abscissum]|uniref:Uncharacterized protein n=1 Tax=Colletotrichum abscissum TaxID=1671311 RepID=A0A9P9XA14_9PEZI|nr:uncharacterized protein CABS01_12463 [Colletotrichum abscissum]KAI3544322.1 hypothetical protein CABS02_09724 [Colletotrichum abscissum]KAK1489882.1 hypothetical protein CABS01_12463 [Colletotrichum abscissum]
MVRQNQKNEADNPETRISGFWLQRSGSLLASLSCRFFTDLISAGSDQERFLPRPIVFMLGRPTEVGNLCRWWYGILTGAVPHGMHMGPIGSNPVAWNIDMAGWIRHPRMDVHIPHRPSQTVPLPACSQPGTHEASMASNHLEAHLDMLWPLPAPHAVAMLCQALLMVPTFTTTCPTVPPTKGQSVHCCSLFIYSTQRSTATNLRLEFRGLTPWSDHWTIFRFDAGSVTLAAVQPG